MPIVFQGPSPMSPGTVAEGGAAEVMLRDNPILAQLLERRRSSFSGGGGGGGGGYSGGIAPSTELQAQADQQAANREQSAANAQMLAQSRGQSGTDAQAGIAGNILLRNQLAQQGTQQANSQALQQAGFSQQDQSAPAGMGDQPQTPPAFTAIDQQSLDEANNVQSAINKQVSDGDLQANEPDAVKKYTDAGDNIMKLVQKKHAAMQYQQQQQLQQLQTAQGHQDGLAIEQANGLAAGLKKVQSDHSWVEPETGMKIPGRYVKKNGETSYIPDPEFMKVATEKLKEMHKTRDAEQKEASKPFKPDHKTAEYMAQKSKPEWADINEAQKHPEFHQEVQKQLAAQEDAHEDRKAAAFAEPKAVRAKDQLFQSVPQQAGKYDLNAASMKQLQGMAQVYSSPKPFGIRPEKAAGALSAIRKEIQLRNNPPAPAESIATPAPVPAMNMAESNPLKKILGFRGFGVLGEP
jgi:hypothetical protein